MKASDLGCSMCGRGPAIPMAVRDIFPANLGDVGSKLFGSGTEVVARYDGKDTNSYGEYDQGYSEAIWVVVKYDDRFFKFMGVMDSYGGQTWNKSCLEVKGTEKVVTVYEFE